MIFLRPPRPMPKKIPNNVPAGRLGAPGKYRNRDWRKRAFGSYFIIWGSWPPLAVLLAYLLLLHESYVSTLISHYQIISMRESHRPKIFRKQIQSGDAPFVSGCTCAIWWPNLSRTFSCRRENFWFLQCL